MDGTFGFRVQVQDKTLATGQCRVKPSTIATVLGSHYVSAAAGAPVNLTLTDKSDSSEWQVQLAWDGVNHYVFSGLRPWLAHCSAKIGEAVEIFREANDASLYVLLVRGEASTTASAPSGQDGSQQQPASQRASMPVSEWVPEGKAAAARPAEQHNTGEATAPVPALHAAGSHALPPAPAAAAAPAEGVQGAQAGPSMSEPRSYVTTAGQGARHFSTVLDLTGVSAPPDPYAGSGAAARYPSGTAQPPTASCAWHPGALPATHAAVAVPQQPVPAARVPWGHGGCGGSGGHPPASDLWPAYGPSYGGAPFRPMDLNQRPLIANQHGPPTGVAGVQGSNVLGDEDGLRLRRYSLHPGHLLAASGTAAGTGADGVAAGPVVCGSVAAAGAGVGGYHYAPVGGAGADLQGASSGPGLPLGPLAEGMAYPQPGEGGNAAGAEDPSGGLWSRAGGGGTRSGGQPPAARKAAGAPAFGTSSGGSPSEVAGLAALDAWPDGADTGVAMRANMDQNKLRLRPHVAAALWPGLADQMPVNQPQEVLLHTVCTFMAARQPGSGAQQQTGELRVYPAKLARYRKSVFRLTGVTAAVRALGVDVGDKEAVGLRRLPCGRVLLERWQQQGPEGEDMQRADSQDAGMPLDEGKEDSGAPAAAAAPAEGVQGAQTGPSLSEPRSSGTTTLGQGARGFSTGLALTGISAPPDPYAGSGVAARYPSDTAQPPTASCAWHPGAPPATHAAIAVPQQPALATRVPWGHGGCGGSDGPPPVADLRPAYGPPYDGAPFKLLDMNQRPLIANQQGPTTGVAGVQGSTGLGYEDGLWLRGCNLHSRQVPAATGTAAGTAEAAGSGVCGSVAAAVAAVRGYGGAPVGGASADLQGASPHAFRPEPARARSTLGPLADGMDSWVQQPEGSEGDAGAEDSSGGLRGIGVEGDTSGAAGATVYGTCSGGGVTEAEGQAAPDARPGGAGAGVAMPGRYNGFVIELRHHVAAALWPALSWNQSQEVLLHTRCSPAAAQPGQPGGGEQQQGEELRVYPMTLLPYRAGFRLTGVVAPAVRDLGGGNKEDVGLRRLPCGRVLLERWQPQGQEGEDMQRAVAQYDGMPMDGAKEGSDEEYVPSPKRRRLQGLAPGGSGTQARLRAQGQQGASALGLQQITGAERAPVGFAPAAAGVELRYSGRFRGNIHYPPLAAVQAFWPQLEAGLKRSPGAANSIQVTVHTSNSAPLPEGTQQAGFGQLGQPHAVRLSYNALGKAFSLSCMGDVLAALGLRGVGVLQLRRTPDGRIWAERIPIPAATPAQQHPAPGLAFAPGLAATALATILGASAAALQQPAPGLAVASAPAAVAPATNTTAAACGGAVSASPAFGFSAWPMPAANALIQPPILPAAAVLATTTTSHPYLGHLHAPAASLVNAIAAAIRLRVADVLRLLQSPDGQPWAALPLLSAANPEQQQAAPDLAASVGTSGAGTGGAVLIPSITALALQQPYLGGAQASAAPVAAAHATIAAEPGAAGPVASIIATNLCPGQLHATAAQAWDVHVTSVSLLPTAAAARSLWPLEAAALEANLYPDHSVPVTLFTAACDGGPAAVAERSARAQQVGGEQGPTEQHTALLHYTAATIKYEVKEAAGVIAALGLRGGDVLRLRWSPDGRTWAERVLLSVAQQKPAPALAAIANPPAACTAAAYFTSSTIAPALQQPGPGLAAACTGPAAVAPSTDIIGTRDGRHVASFSACSPCASPAGTTDAPHPVLCGHEAPSTTTATSTAPLCVSGGCLHPARPTVAALWPECLDMAVGTQQLVRMRAEVWPGGGGDTAEAAAAGGNAGPKRSVTHYGTQLARLGGGMWRLERTHALLRELRLGEGDRVELVPLAGGVVGVRRAGAEEAGLAGRRAVSGDQAAAAAAGVRDGGCGSAGARTGDTGSSRGLVVDNGVQGVGDVPAASAHAAWLKGLMGAAYEEGWRREQQQQHGPQQEGQEDQQGQGQGGEEMQAQDQEQGKEQQEVYIQRQGHGEQQEVHVQQQERREDWHELAEQQGQSQQQDEQRVLQKQEPSGEQGQGQGQGERSLGHGQCQVQRLQHHVGAVYADSCLQRQRCVEQRSALPVDPERASQVPRLDTGQAAMQRDEQRQAQAASAGREVCTEGPYLPQHQVPQPRQGHQQHQQQLGQEQQCTIGTGTVSSSAAEKEWGMGTVCIRGQGQLQQQQQRPTAAHLPAASLTSAHLHGCLPPGLGPPPLQPSELRLCGLTFHPDLAPGVRRAMADWEAGLGGTPLHEVEPEAGQVRVLGAGDAGAAAWGCDGGWSAALVQRYQLRSMALTMELVRLLGLEEEEDWGRELPYEGPVRTGLERSRDGQRGGWGLWTTKAVRKSHPIGVVGGYVMPAAAAKRFVDLGWRDCSEGVKAEVRERVGGDGGRARVSYGWKMLAASYTMPYPAAAQSAQDVPPGGSSGGGRSGGGSAVPPVMSMLGYGTPTALANDPRVNPRAWQHGHDVDADQGQLQPNCGVVFVCVRGLVLPVLVALRDIAPGEQLLRDYGAAWWREVAGVWEMAEDQGLAGEALWHGAGSNA